MSSQDFLNRYNDLTKQADTQAATLAQDTNDAGKIPQGIKDAANQRYNNFSGVLGDYAQAKGDYYNAAPQAWVKYQDIQNPFVRAANVSNDVTAAGIKYDTNNGIKNGIFDTLDKIIGQGVNGYNSMLQGKKLSLDQTNQGAAQALSGYQSELQNEMARQQLAQQQLQLQAYQDSLKPKSAEAGTSVQNGAIISKAKQILALPTDLNDSPHTRDQLNSWGAKLLEDQGGKELWSIPVPGTGQEHRVYVNKGSYGTKALPSVGTQSLRPTMLNNNADVGTALRYAVAPQTILPNELLSRGIPTLDFFKNFLK